MSFKQRIVEHIGYPIRLFTDMELTALCTIYKQRQVCPAVDWSKQLDVGDTSNILNTVIIVKNALLMLFNLLKPSGHVMHQQFNIQQLYVQSTLYLCVLYLSENKQRLVPTA